MPSITREEQTGGNRCRVLFLSDHLGYAEGVTHGASTYFLNVLPALKATGIPLAVCFLRERHPIADQLEAAGVKPVFLERGKWDVRACTDLVRLIRAHDVNLVHAAGMKGILMGRLAARRTGAKFLAHLHDMNPLNPVTKCLQRLSAGWTDGCLGISNAVCEYAVETLGVRRDKVRVLHNALPSERFSILPDEKRRELRRSLDVSNDDRILLIIGRLSPEKGHEPFIRGGAEWFKAHPQTRLLIVGGGRLQEGLQQAVSSLGLGEQVRFLGYRDDVPALLSIADVLLIPSLFEGLGYTALEAMVAEVPVAAFAVGGVPEIVEDGETGLLAQPGDVAHLLEQVERLLTDQALRNRLTQNGRRKAKLFSVEAHVQQVAEIYTSLLHGSFNKGVV